MALRKQPDRQVKKKHMIEMAEKLDITERKRKLEEPRVEIKFKMAPRKQPDRQVKKKCKLEMPENLDMIEEKRKLELEEPSNFDIIGTLVSNYGMTGENLVRNIFSYMKGMFLNIFLDPAIITFGFGLTSRRTFGLENLKSICTS